MTATDEPSQQASLEAAVGHPDEKFSRLRDRVQDEVLRSFQAVESDFLDLLWTLDAYRIKQVVPRGMGVATLGADRRLEGIYRGKGNYLSTIIALVLGNKTTSQLAARRDVMGFSQPHQIDIAWPARDMQPLVDPFICAEAKLTGAPGFPGNKGRGAMDDWSNRRKELKFQATDLKLYRHRAEGTPIRHWDLWRRQAMPSVYSLWAARLRPTDDVHAMIREAQILTDTYSDGVGIYAFRENSTATGYEPTALSKGVDARVTSLDNVLDLIAAQIHDIMDKHDNRVPEALVATDNPASHS